MVTAAVLCLARLPTCCIVKVAPQWGGPGRLCKGIDVGLIDIFVGVVMTTPFDV
jgi:hypothetical protein